VQLTAVYGAPTPPGRLAAALEYVIERLERPSEGRTVHRIDLHEGGTPGTQEAVRLIGESAAVVLASPVYRASIPGVLKTLLDHLPVDSLRDKPVALLVMGATSHHYLGVDRHARDILSWFGALALPTSVYLTGADFVDGAPAEPARSALEQLAGSLVYAAERLGDGQFGPPPLASGSA
jgi:FMN reductase